MANVRFHLEMNGTKVRTLEELQKHPDASSIIAAFQDGTLMLWLENLTLKDYANKLRAIDKNAADCQKQVFDVLGIKGNEVDGESIARLNEKKTILARLTDNELYINRAEQTALDQADLAELLHAGESTIYLVGNENVKFHVPVEYKNKQYVGIIEPPIVEVDASSMEQLERNGIVFENVKLPAHLQQQASQVRKEDNTSHQPKKSRHSSSRITVEELREIFNAEFGVENSASALMSGGSYIENGMGRLGASLGSVSFAEARRAFDKEMRHAAMSGAMRDEWEQLQKDRREILENEYKNQKPSVWSVVNPCAVSGIIGMAPDYSEAVKSSIIRRICKGKYTEEDLVHICVSEDRSEGWACTIDSFCFCINGVSAVIPYSDMRAVVPRVVTDYDWGEGKGQLFIVYEDGAHHELKILKGKTIEGDYEHIASYLAKVGDYYDLQLNGPQAQTTLANVMDMEEGRQMDAMLRLSKSDGEY